MEYRVVFWISGTVSLRSIACQRGEVVFIDSHSGTNCPMPQDKCWQEKALGNSKQILPAKGKVLLRQHSARDNILFVFGNNRILMNRLDFVRFIGNISGLVAHGIDYRVIMSGNLWPVHDTAACNVKSPDPALSLSPAKPG